MQEKVVLGRTWQKKKKKGQSLENSIPGMGSGVQIVQYFCIVVST
jgi:hypothetical protein